MKRYYTQKQLTEIRAKLLTIEGRTNTLVLKFVYYRFKSDKAREYAQHGFGRRVQLLRRCIENVFRIVPPGTIKIPSKSRLYDAQINIQAFFANAYGIVDNLAWIWVYERGLKLPRKKIGFRKHHNEVRSSFSGELQKYIDGLDTWFNYLVEYRDALAHRIPPYIPPGAVLRKNVVAYNDLMSRMNAALGRLDSFEYERLCARQNALLIFQPLITHSVTETTAHFAFHPQLIADFLTVEELGNKVLSELGRIDRA